MDGKRFGVVNVRRLGCKLVLSRLVTEDNALVGVASGGNIVLCEINGTVVERKDGEDSVFPLRLFSAARDDRTASVGAYEGENDKRLVVGRSRGLVGMEAIGDGARERAGEMLRERTGVGVRDDTWEGTRDRCGRTIRDSTGVSMSTSRGTSSHIDKSGGIIKAPSLSKGMSIT